MSIIVRLAARADAPLLARLRHTWTAEDGPCDDAGFDDRFAAWFEREAERRLFWLALDDGEPVGMINMLVFERMPRPARDIVDWGYIGNTYVVPALRDRGLGRMLPDAPLAHARQARFARVVLNPSARSVPFYTRAGFAPATSLMLVEL